MGLLLNGIRLMFDAFIVALMGAILVGYGVFALRNPGSDLFRPTSALHTDQDTSSTGRAIGALAVGLGTAGLVGALLLLLT